MKATTGWYSPNTGASNESGFTGLGGGYRFNDGTYYDYVGIYGGWWSSTEYNSFYAWNRLLYYVISSVNRINDDKRFGFSVRCLRD